MKTFEHATPWENWADEYLLYMRALNPEYTIIEAVRAKVSEHPQTNYRHEVIFLDEYLTGPAAETLNEILAAASYCDLTDFVACLGGTDADCSIEKLTQEMKMHLALLIVEHNADHFDTVTGKSTDIVMREADAIEQVHKVLGYKASDASVRHARCRDCAVCKDLSWEDGVGPFCREFAAAVNPNMRVFTDVTCEYFRYNGNGNNCFCVRSKSKETGYDEAVAYVVADSSKGSRQMIDEMKAHKMLDLSDRTYDLLTFHPWDFRTQSFAASPKNDRPEEKCHMTSLLLRKVDEALERYGNDVVSVDLNEETGMFDINLCYISHSDCYAKGIVAEDMVIKKSLIDGLFVRNVGYTFDA